MHGEGRRPVFPARRLGGCHRFRTSTCSIFICPQCTHRTPRRGRPTPATCTGSSTRCRRRSISTGCCGRSSTSSRMPSTATPASSTWSSPTTRSSCAQCPIRTLRSSVGCGSSPARDWPDGWPQHDEPVFLAEGALTDPRAKVVPEAEEDRYQSLVRRAAARQGGRGDRRHLASLRGAARVHAGRLGLHDARREPGRGRDRERPPLRADATPADAGRGPGRPVARRVGGLDARAAASRGGPPRAAAAPRRGMRGLRGLGRRRPVPARRGVARRPGSDTPLTAAEIGVELARAAADGGDGRHMAELLWGTSAGRALVVPLVAADELVGVLALRMSAQRPIDPEERELAASIAGQTAVGITNVRMIERLTAHNAIKDFLEDLLGRPHARRRPARARPRRWACDVDLPHVVLLAVPRSGPATRSWDDVARALEVAAGRTFPGSLFDRRDGAVRGLVHLGSRDAAHAVGAPARDPRRAQQGPPARDRPVAALRGRGGLTHRVRGGRARRHRGGDGQRDPRRGRVRRPGRVQVPAAREPGRPHPRRRAARRCGSSTSTTAATARSFSSRSRST